MRPATGLVSRRESRRSSTTSNPDRPWNDGAYRMVLARNRMQVVRLADGVAKFSLPQHCLALAPDGRDYAMRDGANDQWTLQSADKSKTPIHFGSDGDDEGDTFIFSPDGRYIASGATD